MVVFSGFMLVATSVLLSATFSTIILYYRRIRDLGKEYNNAKGIVDRIIMSVNSQFKRHTNLIHFVTKDLQTLSFENKKVRNKIEQYEAQLSDLANSLSDAPNIEEKFFMRFENIRKDVADIKETQNKVVKKLAEIEDTHQKAYAPEIKIEAAIPIRKEKALEPLTETELMVLETIGKEGEKTAPEIREIIELTREHTARLMKKLYKDGYLERDTHKMPYMYRLKEEMKKILKKREASPS